MSTYDKFDELYDALSKDGAVSKSREYFKSKMTAPGEEGYKNRKALFDALKADGAITSKDYGEFSRKLGLHAVSPAPKQEVEAETAKETTPAQAKANALPKGFGELGDLHDLQKAPMQRQREDTEMQEAVSDAFSGDKKRAEAGAKKAAELSDRIAGEHGAKNAAEYEAAQHAIDLSRPLTDEERDYVQQKKDAADYRMATGKDLPSLFGGKEEEFFVDEDDLGKGKASFRAATTTAERDAKGNITGETGVTSNTGALQADREQRQGRIDKIKEKEAQDIENERANSTEGKEADIKESEARIKELEGKLAKRREELDEQNNGANLVGGSIVGNVGGVMRQGMYDADEQYTALAGALREEELRLRSLNDRRYGGNDDYWWNVFRGAQSSIEQFLGADVRSDIAKLGAEAHRYGVDKGADEAYQDLLKSQKANEDEQALANETGGLGREFGQLTGNSAIYSLPFMFGGKAIKMLQVASRAALRGTVANGVAQQAAKKTIGAALKKYAKRALGAAAEDTAIGFTGATTVGAPGTLHQGVQNLTGHIEQDEKGNYYYTGGDNIAHAFTTALLSNSFEYSSEVAGEHMEHLWAAGKKAFAKSRAGLAIDKMFARTNTGNPLVRYYHGIKDAVSAWAEKFGKTAVGKVAGEFAGGAQRYWKAAHIQGLPWEGLEEELNNIENALFQTGQGDWSDVADGEQRLKLWAGLAISMGTTGAVAGTFANIGHGARMVGQYRAKHAMDNADILARYRLTEDVWSPIKTEIDNAENKDMGAVLNKAMQSVSHTEERKAILNYAEKLLKYRGYNIATTVENAENGEGADAGDASYAAGYEATDPKQMQEAKGKYDAARKALEDLGFDIDNQDVEAHLEMMRGAVDEDGDAIFTSEDMQPYVDYLNARARFDGMMQRVEDDIDSRIAASDAIVDSRKHKADGMIHSATMSENGNMRKVYVTGGNVVMTADGKVDTVQSDSSIAVRDAETGDVRIVSPSDITSMDEPADPEQLKAEAADALREQYTQEASDNIDGTPKYGVNDTFTMTDAEGKEVSGMIQNITEDGVEVSDGKRVWVVPVEEFEDNVSQLADANGNVTWQRLQANTEAEEGKFSLHPTAQVEESVPLNDSKKPTSTNNQPALLGINSSESSASESTEQNSEKQAEGEKSLSALDRVPQNAKGEPMYEQVDSDTAWDALVEQCGGDVAMAQSVADDMVKDKETALKKAQKAQSKGGSTPAEKIASLKERKANIDAAQTELDKWKRIAETTVRRKQTEEDAKKREKQARLDAAIAERKQRAEATAQNADGTQRDTESQQTETNGGRPTDIGGTSERQSDLEKTEEVKLSDEIDENGHPFIKSSNGTTIFGEITEDSGLSPAPIKLSEGFNKTEEGGNNIGYGLQHIVVGHGKQILDAGYNSVQEFVEDVCRNYKEIRIGKDRKSNKTYMLLELHDEKHKRTLFVELSHDGTYWNVNSGGIFRNNYTDKNDIVWPLPTVGSNANTNTAEVIDSPAEAAKGETVDRGGDSSQPISSVDKATNNQSTLQEKDEKSSESKKVDGDKVAENKNKPSILKEWSEDGSTSISPAEKQQPADTENISALDTSSAGKVNDNRPAEQEKGKKKSDKTESVVSKMQGKTDVYVESLHALWSKENAVMKAAEEEYEAEYKAAMEEFKALQGKQEKTDEEGARMVKLQRFLNGNRADRVMKRFKAEMQKRYGKEIAAAQKQYMELVEMANSAGGISEVVDAYANLYALGMALYQQYGKAGGKDAEKAADYIEMWQKHFLDYLETLTDDELVDGAVKAVVSLGGPRIPFSPRVELSKVVERAASLRGKERVKAALKRRGEKAEKNVGAAKTDSLGNPLNEDGTLKVEEIGSIDELTDKDFENPARNVALPALPAKVDEAIGAEGKKVVIKKNIFERNRTSHSDLTAAQSREILKSALYTPDLYGQNQYAKRPYNWIVINTKDEKGHNRIVLLEVNQNKDNVEIVHWHYVDERGLEKIRKQAEREDGQLLILPSEKSEEAGALSSPTTNLSSGDKGTKRTIDKQELQKEKGKSIDDYVSEMKPMQKANARRFLEQPIFSREFGSCSMAETIEKAVSVGWKISCDVNKSKITYKLYSPEKNSVIDLGNTGLDYALYIGAEYSKGSDTKEGAEYKVAYYKYNKKYGFFDIDRRISLLEEDKKRFANEEIWGQRYPKEVEEWHDLMEVKRLRDISDDVSVKISVKRFELRVKGRFELHHYTPEQRKEYLLKERTHLEEIIKDSEVDLKTGYYAEKEYSRLAIKDNTARLNLVNRLLKETVANSPAKEETTVPNNNKPRLQKVGEGERSVNEKFNEELEAYVKDGVFPENGRFELGLPSNILLSAGFPELPISMRVSLLNKKAGMERHPFSPTDLYDMVEAIQKPLAIFEYSKPNMRNLIIDLTKGNKHFLVGVTLDYRKGELAVNSVSGLFPKESHEWIKWIQDGKVIRIDQKEKVLSLIDSLRTNPEEAERIGLNLNSVAKIVKDFENPNISDWKIQNGTESAQTFAEKHGVDVSDVEVYENAMKQGHVQTAHWAMGKIRRTCRMNHKEMKLSEFGKWFNKVEEELYERFGNLDELEKQYKEKVMAERGAMEAARKKAEEEESKREKHLEELALLSDEEIDKRYMKAVDKGDEATAREMLDESARRKGYSDADSDYQGVGAWSAPSNPGYGTDAERRADEDNAIFNVEDMALGYSSQPSDYLDNPRAYGYDNAHGRESASAINTAIDAVERGDKGVKVKVYRAVPESVKEGKLRNGDWVTPSRAYAEMHGENRLGGKYRIIEDEVPADELWWDGNDVNEWGYDNGKAYKYRNAKNNRKLNDLVTRDDEGNIIPPSKRFNSRKADERYHRGGAVEPISKEELALREAVVERLRESGIEVITDVEAGQRVLDMANDARLEAKRVSQKRKWVDTYVNAMNAVTGRDKKDVRAELLQKMEEARREAKELYDRVLSGNFDAVTLQQINDYIDHATNRNRFYRPLSQRLPARALLSLPKGERTGSVDALFSRICESAVGKNGRVSAEGRRRIEEKKEELLEKWAKATGNWHESVADFTGNTTAIKSGTDSDVYLSNDGKTVIKASKGKFGNKKFPSDVDQVALFNSVFPDSAYRILGYGRVNGKFVKFLEQDFVDFSTSTPLTEEERLEYMHKLGFEPINEEKTLFSNDDIVVSDLQKSNIVRDASGNIRVIDADVKLYTKDIGGNWTYPEVEEDFTTLDNNTDDAARLHKVYHGSGADFDEFDHSHMGEGEGAQAFGWGTYVTEVEGIGRAYAEAASQKPSVEQDKAFRAFVKAKHVFSEAKYKYDTKKELGGDEKALQRLEKKMISAKEKMDEIERYADTLPEPQKELYTVEIPDDTGENYIDYNGKISDIPSQKIDAICEQLEQLGWERKDLPNMVRLTDGYDNIVLNPNATGADLYEEIKVALKSDKQASLLLSKAGFTGIKYPAGYMRGGLANNAQNYVIFNEADAKITDKVRFFRTANGEAYGFTVGGKIYIDPRIASSETLVHEYAHLWASALKAGNPKEWKNVVALMKGTSVWDEVKRLYPELKTDDEIADEVIAQYSGRRGAERLREEARKIAEGKGGVFEKAEAISALEKVKRALSAFWKGVCDMLHIHYTSAEEVADRVMKDLLDGVDPRKFGKTDELRMQENEEIADIVAKAKADGTYMKAPNGKPSNLNERQWAQVRTKAFKEWFGDWEKTARIEKLRGSEPVEITGEEYKGKYELNRESAKAWIKDNLRGEYINEDTKERIEVRKDGAQKVTSHSMGNEAHLKSLVAIPELIEKSIFIEERPNEKNNGKYDSYRYYVCGLNIGGTDYTVKITVGVKGGSKYYDHALTQIEKGSLLDNIDALSTTFDTKETVNGFMSTGAEPNPSVTIGKDTKLLSILQTNSSKVVDENGEPRVVYHGTGNEFTAFDRRRIRKRRDGLRGFFFTTNRSTSQYYGNEMPCFLNMRHPLIEMRGQGERKTIEPAVKNGSIKQYDGTIAYANEEIKKNPYLNRGLAKDGIVEIVAFSPNQIKSATENVGTFDAKNNDIRFQFVGERGAAAADRAEEVTTRLDNLGVAREMEEAKKDAKAIKMATGWERGADGKWRYEIPDIDFNVSGDANWSKILDRQPWAKELEELSDRIFDGEQLSVEEMARFDELCKESDDLYKTYKESDVKYLDDYAPNDALYKAYPELKQVKVEFVYNPSLGWKGMYSQKESTIFINGNSDLSYRDTLAHEIQHAIQRIEGFARGGNVESVRSQIQSIIDEEQDASDYAKQQLKRYAALHLLAARLGAYKTFMKSDQQFFKDKAYEYYWDAMNELDNEEGSKLVNEYPADMTAREIAESGYHVDEAIKELKRLGDEYKDEIPEGNMDALEEVNKFTSALKDKSDAELYRALAGEVESRNVQKRMGMTEEQRRASLAAETEDVAREDQLFLFGEGGMNASVSDVRTMSEEEKRKRGEKLLQASAIDVEKGQIKKTDGKSARQSAVDWWKENVGGARSYDTEVGVVDIDEKSVGDSLAHRYSQAKLDAVTSLAEGFDNAVYLGSMPDFTRQEGVSNHYFAYPINYDGKRCYVFCRAMQDINKNRLYVHEVFVADNLNIKGDTLQTAAFQPHGGIALYRGILSGIISAAKVAEYFGNRKVSNENVVDGGGMSASVVSPLEMSEANLKSAVDAMNKIADGAEYVPNAVIREDLEQYGGDRNVGIYWGKAGNPENGFKKGYGLAHIGAKHGAEVIRQILDVLCNGKIDRYVKGNKTVILSNGKFECVLALTKNGNKETWSLTGWDKIEKADGNSEVSTQSVPMQGNPTFSRTDLGAALSAANIGRNSETSSEEDNLLFRTVFGGNKGYVGYSKSKRATRAEEEGKRSASNFDRTFVEDVNTILQGVGANGITIAEAKRLSKNVNADEWHHTSMYGNKTNYYSPESIAYAAMNEAQKAAYDQQKEAEWQKEKREIKERQERQDAEREARRKAIEEAVANRSELVPVRVDDFVDGYWVNLDGVHVRLDKSLNERTRRYDEGVDKEEAKILASQYLDNLKAEVEKRVSESVDEKQDLWIVNERFNKRLDELVKDPEQKNKVLRLGRASQFLKKGGMTDAEIVLDFDKFVRKSGEKYKNHHPFSASDLKNLPMAIANPIAVFNRANIKDHVVLTELQKDGRNFIVVIRAVEQHRKGGVVLEVNQITSLYPKEGKGIVNWINTGRISNVDKEKALHFIEALQPHAGTTIKAEELSSAAKVVKDFVNPKVADKNVAEEGMKLRLLEDDDPKAQELEALPDSELVPVYRNVQVFEDDALGSPMAFTDAETGERRELQGQKWNYSNPPEVKLTEEQQRQLDELNKNGYIVVDGKKTTELQINNGLKFVKPKTKEAQLQYFLKKNPEDSGLWAAYDPYDHAIETPLNTQFGEAYKRPNLVVVRSLIPKSEIDEPFKADYALLPTGAHQWNNGRTLYLSRWSKIDKVLTREEEAKLIDEYWKKNPGKREALKTHRDYNRFVPQVRRELEKMGYRFELNGKELTPEESLALDTQNWENRDVIPGREGNVPFVSNDDIKRINAKMAGKWVGEPKEAMENAMADRVNELADRLHTPVRIIRTDEEIAALPSARQRRMKGSFNPMTGEVTIVVPNNANMADVENTFIHEVVGHDGLRVLFPEKEKLNNALDELYRVSNEGIRNTIDRMAQKMYDAEVDRLREKKRKEHEAKGEDANAHYYTDMAEAHAEASKKREQFRRDATEEYGADLAGRIGEKGFEKMSAEELTFWGKLKSMLQKALQKLLAGLKIPGKRKWSDKDWAFVLHEAYKRKKNGGKPDVFDAADTEVMRRKTGFGETKFSDGIVAKHSEKSIDEINNTFNEELQQQIDGKLPTGHIYKMGKPGKVLLSTGVPNLPIQMNAKRLQDKATMFNHDFNLSEVRDLVKALQHPLAVFAYGDKSKAQNIIVPLQKDGKNFIVGLSLNPTVGGRKLEINSIRNVFPKDNSEWLNWINQDKALYIDKEKIQTLIDQQRTNLADVEYLDLDSVAKVVKDFVNPKVSDENVSDEDIMFRDGDDVDYEKAHARDIYEERVARGMFQTQEALQDSMLGLKEAMNAILQAEHRKLGYIEDVAGFENAYLGENRLSSVNQAECDAFARLLFKPMLKAVARLAKTAYERAELTDYMMAKHGLERNEVMAMRAAQKKANEEFAKELRKAERAVAKNPHDQDAIDALDDVKQRRADREQELYFENRGKDYAGLTALTGTDNVANAEWEAKLMVAAYESAHDTTDLWDKVNAVNKATLQKTYESGLISKDTYDDISGMYKNYIPLRGFDEKTSAEAYAYLNGERGGFAAPIKTARGRKSKADDPFANMEAMAESAIMQGNRNTLVKQKFLNFVMNHPSDLVSVNDLWLQYDSAKDEWKPVFADNIDENDSPAEVERKIKDFNDRMEQLAHSNPDEYKRQKEHPEIPFRVVEKRDLAQHQVLVKRNGKTYVITINGNPRAAQALNGLTNPDNDSSGAIGKMLEVGEAINRQLSAFYTTRNPDFVVSNFLRDALYSNTMAWVKESPNYAIRFNLNFLKVNPGVMKWLFARYRNNTLNLNNGMEKMFRDFMMNGGETGYASIRDIEQRKSAIKRELKREGKTISAGKALSMLGERLDEYNRAVENCARFAAYMTSREMGRSIDRSIYDAKEISVNFNKKGSGAKFVSARGQKYVGKAAAFVSGVGRVGYVFWNAAIQGTTNFGRQAKRHPVKAVVGMASMFLLGALIGGMGGDGDDDYDAIGKKKVGTDKNSYYNIPEYVRRSNIMFRSGDSWICIPLPVEYRAIYGMGELAATVMRGGGKMSDAEIATAAASQMSQLLPLDFMEGGGGMQSFVPSAAKPVYEVWVNNSWTGLPIYKDNEYNRNMPGWTKAYKSANSQLVELSKALNEATGGDKYTKGAVDINPAAVEYLLKGYFGGVESTVDKMVKSAETVAGKRDYDPRSVLLLNRVVKKGDERTEYRALTNEYYRMKEEYGKLQDRLRGYTHDTNYSIFDFAKKVNTIYNSPEYGDMLLFNAYDKVVSKYDQLIKNTADPAEQQEYERLRNEARRKCVEVVSDKSSSAEENTYSKLRERAEEE